MIGGTAVILGISYWIGHIDGYEAHRKDMKKDYDDYLYGKE